MTCCDKSGYVVRKCCWGILGMNAKWSELREWFFVEKYFK